MRGRAAGETVHPVPATSAITIGFSVVLALVLLSCGQRQAGIEPAASPTGGKPEAAVLEVRPGTPNPPRTVTLRSEVLGEPRRVYIQLPEGYEGSTVRYPVLVVLDGEWLFQLARANAAFFSELEEMGITVPKMIVVGIENVDRDRDYTPTARSGQEFSFPTAGGADRFLAFLADELVPYLDREYRTAPGRVVAGWSFGGLFATYAALAAPELFDGHLCISPAVWWDDEMVVNGFETARFDRPKRMVFTLGTGEAGGLVGDSTARLLERLEARPIDNLTVTSIKFDGVGHTWGIPGAFDKGLQAVFSGYVPPDGAVTSSEDLTAYYQRLSESWGFQVDPPVSTVIAEASAMDNADEGIAMLDRLLASDPNAAMAHYAKGRLQRSLGRREEARASFEAALAAERRRSVPQSVDLRGFEKAVASVSETGPNGASHALPP